MKKLPVIPTLVVALTVAIMIALGIWQLRRADEKAALIAQARSNPARPAVSFPRQGPVDPGVLFRPSSLICLRVVGWQTEAGRGANGQMGFRLIAQCTTGAEGPGALVNLGIADRPDAKSDWTGGRIAGWISQEPDHRSLLSRALGKSVPLRPMLIARVPAKGLRAASPPHVEDLPNNHIAYAVQWFLFAGIATLIYGLVLRRRRQAINAPSSPA